MNDDENTESKSAKCRIYVASSWRNPVYPDVVKALRALGHEVYDFRNPAAGGPAFTDPRPGFSWAEIDPHWQEWSPKEFLAALSHPIAQRGWEQDHAAMEWADTFVLVLPCGRSAHLEAGWAIGRGKAVHILMLDGQEPELMYSEALAIGGTIATGFVELARDIENGAAARAAEEQAHDAFEAQRGATIHQRIIEKLKSVGLDPFAYEFGNALRVCTELDPAAVWGDPSKLPPPRPPEPISPTAITPNPDPFPFAVTENMPPLSQPLPPLSEPPPLSKTSLPRPMSPVVRIGSPPVKHRLFLYDGGQVFAAIQSVLAGKKVLGGDK